MRRLLPIALCLAAPALGLAAPRSAFIEPEQEPTSAPPNVLFLLVDDLGWKDLGYSGSTFYETPAVDSLAATGTAFRQAYAACPVCSPTRASILAGKYPARMATTDWFGAPQPEGARKRKNYQRPLLPAAYLPQLPLEEVTLAEALREAGYATGFFGKWHLGREGFGPTEQGFDHNVAGYFRGMPPAGYFSPYKIPTLEDGPEGEHLPARLGEECARFMRAKAKAGEPFLAYLSFYSVHTPLQATQELKAKYEEKRSRLGLENTWGQEGTRKVREVQEHAVYGGMVEAMDSAVGRVLNELRDLGIEDNTIVVFFSDNGGLSTSEGHPTSNLPLRAGKGWLYEGGIREPCIVRWPGVTAPGSVCDTPVVSTDFYPTLLEALGQPARPEQHRDGVSLVPLLRDPSARIDRALYWHYPHYGNQGASPGSALRVGNWKLIEWFEKGRPLELYDLSADPGETRNLARAQPERLRSLAARLAGWRDAIGARYPSPNPRLSTSR